MPAVQLAVNLDAQGIGRGAGALCNQVLHLQVDLDVISKVYTGVQKKDQTAAKRARTAAEKQKTGLSKPVEAGASCGSEMADSDVTQSDPQSAP